MNQNLLKVPAHQELVIDDDSRDDIDSLIQCKSEVITPKVGLISLLNKTGGGKHQRVLSSTTVSSSIFSDKYAEEPEKLDWTVAQLTDKHIKMYEKCNQYRKSEAQVHFDHIASNYEGMYQRMGYPDPKYVANFVAKYAKRAQIQPEDAKVIDFGCGTGLVGKNLSAQGFKNIIGLDVSPNMLEECSNKGVYSELFEQTLGNADEFPDMFKNQFDFVTCAGLVNNNHMDYLLFEEMLLAVKKGGYVVFTARFSYMGKYWYDDIIKEMHDDGRWTLLSTDTFFKYDQLDEVSIGRFSRTPVKVFVFQKQQEEIKQYVSNINNKLKNFLRMKSLQYPKKF